MERNQVQLIAYADSMGGSIIALHHALNHSLSGLFTGVHVLPPFLSSGDRGFAPIDYAVIEPSFGTWDDMTALAKDYDVMVDIMVNHISRLSPPFRDYMEKGDDSAYADFFITPRKVWGDNPPTTEEENAVLLRRPSHYSTYTRKDGKRVTLWTTFGATDPSEQIDLDITCPKVLAYFEHLLDDMQARGIRYVRLDAVGYVAKKRGTSCFMVEPEVTAFIRWIADEAGKRGIEVLNEVHDTQEVRNRLAAEGFTGYDFLLPMAVLQSLISRDGTLLRRVMQDRPHNLVTVLDCHDGIPLQPDMGAMLSAEQAWQVVNTCRERGARFTELSNEQMVSPDYPRVHQICGTLYSLLGEDGDAFVLARAIQLFVPGIVQIYYAGLLACTNDEQQRRAERDNRALNRHNYTADEIDAALNRPEVQRVIRLIRLKRSHPAFSGEFLDRYEDNGEIEFTWRKGGDCCGLRFSLKTMSAQVFYTADGRGLVREAL